MADNSVLNPGTGGDNIATDEITGGVANGAKVQRIKPGYGADGSYTDVTTLTGLPIQGTQTAVATTSWTSATSVNTANSISVAGMNTVTVAMANTSTMTAGVLTFEVSPDNTNWFSVAMARIDSYTAETSYTLNAVANRAWSTSVDGFTNFRVRLSTVISGTGTAVVLVTAQAMPIEPIVTVGQSVAASLNATVTGTVTATPSGIQLGVAEDAAITGNRLITGERGHAAVPTAMSADNDVVTGWNDRSGARVVIPQPRQTFVQVTPTITTTAYTAGDQLGGIMTVAAALASGRPGELRGVTLFDRSSQSINMELWFFLLSPASPAGDNAAAVFTDANFATAIPLGVVDILTANYRQMGLGGQTVATGTLNGGSPVIPFVTSGSANIFCMAVVRGAPTYAVGDLTFNFTLNQF
jgi:hypothetical protein